MRAARAVVEADGIAALSMRRVAEELGVVPMAIYRHVRDKNELLVLLVDAAYNELSRPRLPKDSRKRLTALWLFLRGGLAKYPWVVDAIVRSDVMAPSVLPQMQEILHASTECGLGIEQAADAYRIVWQYTVGELMLHAAALERMHSGKPSMVVQTLLDVDEKTMPALAAAARYWFLPPRLLAYERGLSIILDGILAQATHRRAERPARLGRSQ